MIDIALQQIGNANQGPPLMQETNKLLDQVRTGAFELFNRRGRVSGNEMRNWLQAEKEVFRVPDIELARPKPVDVDHVSASLAKGVLQVRASKAERDQGKKAAA